MVENEVWKYEVAVTDTQDVEMPGGAELLHAGTQDDFASTVTVWARVNPATPDVRRRLLIRGTGHVIGDEPYVGTVVFRAPALVWHVFDGGEVE